MTPTCTITMQDGENIKYVESFKEVEITISDNIT